MTRLQRQGWLSLPLWMHAWNLMYVGFTGLFVYGAITQQFSMATVVFSGSCYVIGWGFVIGNVRAAERRSREHRRRRANHPGGAGGGSRPGIRSRFAHHTREGDRPGVAAPDSAVPVVGYRTWSLVLPVDDQGYWLSSCTRGILWPARGPLIAKCLYGHDLEMQGLDGPAEACSCGVYAMKVPEVSGGPVLGAVHLWGKVIEHKRGYRAQFAYPARLLLLGYFFSDASVADRIARELAERYGVPCDVATTATRSTLLDAQ